MSRHSLVIALTRILVTLLVLAVYVVYYLMPNLQVVNHLKRQAKDLTLKINDTQKKKLFFRAPDDAEKSIFTQMDIQFSQHIPEIRSRDEWVELMSGIMDYIQRKAEEEGVANAIAVTSTSEFVTISPLLVKDKKLREDLEAMVRRHRDELPQASLEYDFGPGFSRLASQVILLAFTEDFSRALNFVNRLPWSFDYMSLGGLQVHGGPAAPFFLASLQVYFLDLRPGQKNVPPPPSTAVDLNSDLLLRRLEMVILEPWLFRALPLECGANPFAKGLSARVE